MKINLQIEHLTFSGIPLSQADQMEVSNGLQAELSRLLALGVSDRWKSSVSQRKINARAIQYHPGSTPVQLGREIAASLARAIIPGQDKQGE